MTAPRSRLWRAELDAMLGRVASASAYQLVRLSQLHGVPVASVERPNADVLEGKLSALLCYARTGSGAVSDHHEATRAFVTLADLFAAWVPALVVPSQRGDAAMLSEVSRAVLARINLATHYPVTRASLAALAGVSSTTVCDAIAAGVLATCEPRGAGTHRGSPARDVTAPSARAWLLSRGVEGLT